MKSETYIAQNLEEVDSECVKYLFESFHTVRPPLHLMAAFFPLRAESFS